MNNPKLSKEDGIKLIEKLIVSMQTTVQYISKEKNNENHKIGDKEPIKQNWFYHDLALECVLILLSHLRKHVDLLWFKQIRNDLYRAINVSDLKLSEFYWRKIAVCFEADVFHFAKLYDQLGLKKLTFQVIEIFKMSKTILKSISTITHLHIS